MNIGYIMQEGVDILRPPFNGPANHVRDVLEAFGRRGHSVRVIVRVNGRIWRSDDLEEFTPVTVRWMDRGALRLMERAVRRLQAELHLPYAALFESLRFAQACVQELRDCDLLYERLSWVSYGGALAARRLSVPLILEDNGDPLFDLEAKGIAPTGLQRRLSMALMRRTVLGAAHVVSTGDGWRGQFIKRWKYPPTKVTTVENGTTLVSRLARDQLRSFKDADESKAPVTFVYLGGFYPWHGVPVLLEAFSAARREGVHARLLMIGAGDGLAEARELAAKLNLNGALTLAGHLTATHYAPLLANADVGLAPYCGWPEFSGLKVLDYKAAGLPTIASGQDGQPPTLRDGHTGIIVPPCDADALCSAIIRLSTDRPLIKRMGQASRVEAEAMHGWEHTVERVERVLRDVYALKVA
jgi:glycosyltransferase involved in cell wall biosynthesis